MSRGGCRRGRRGAEVGGFDGAEAQDSVPESPPRPQASLSNRDRGKDTLAWPNVTCQTSHNASNARTRLQAHSCVLVILRANLLWGHGTLGQSAAQASSMAWPGWPLTFLVLAVRASEWKHCDCQPPTRNFEHAALRWSAVSRPSKYRHNPPPAVNRRSTWICRHHRCLKLPERRRAAARLHPQARQASARA